MNIERFAELIKLNFKHKLEQEGLLPPIEVSKPKLNDQFSKMLEFNQETQGFRVVHRASQDGQLINVIKRRRCMPISIKDLESLQLSVPMPALSMRRTASLNEVELKSLNDEAFGKVSPIGSNQDIVKQIRMQIVKLRKESSTRISSLKRTPSQVKIRQTSRHLTLKSLRSRSERRLTYNKSLTSRPGF